MIKIVIIFTIISIGLYRYFLKKSQKKESNFTLISTFIQALPFAFGKSFYTFFNGVQVQGYDLIIGPFRNSLRVEIELVFFLILIFLGFSKLSKKSFSFKQNSWFYVFLILCVISYVNPNNYVPFSFLPLLIFILQLILLLKLIETNFSRDDIIKGIFDGLAVIASINLILTICYPVLGLEFAVTVFSEGEGLGWAVRRGVSSAVGIFGHPGTLALSSLITLIFFYSCYLNKYKIFKSKVFIAMNLFIIALTFSRTTYLTSVVILISLTIISKKNISVFSFKNILIFFTFFIGAIFILYLTPLSDMFLGEEAFGQVQNRLIHYIIGFEIWQNSPIFGIGINEHIYYMQETFNMGMLPSNGSESAAFYLRSPIHNIHIIVLAETGIIGFFCWLYYFVSKINFYSKNSNTKYIDNNILSLSFTGMLIVLFVYGFTGWSPFRLDIFPIVFVIGFFAKTFLQETKFNNKL